MLPSIATLLQTYYKNVTFSGSYILAEDFIFVKFFRVTSILSEQFLNMRVFFY